MTTTPNRSGVPRPRPRWRTWILAGLTAAATAALMLVGPQSAMAAAASTAATTAASTVAATTVAPALSTDDIKLAQRDLDGLDYNAGGVDGIAGSQTQTATTAFQSDRCLQVDGVLGTQTLTELKSVVGAVQAAAGMTPDGDYAAATTAAVKTYQSAHGLEVDGIAGPATMAAMGIDRQVASCHTPSALGAQVVSIASAEIGTRADSSKCVPGKPYNICADWCAAFATWVWRQAGIDIPFMTYVPSVYDWAVSNHRWLGTSQLGSAMPGYLIIFGTATNRYHIGIVDHVSGGTVWVISGNTTNPANSSQWGVYDKQYALSGSVFYGLVTL